MIVVESEPAWYSPPHLHIKVLVESLLPLHSLLVGVDPRPPGQPHQVQLVISPASLKQEVGSHQLQVIFLIRVEEEEEQVSVTVLKLDVWQLSSNNSSYLQLIID